MREYLTSIAGNQRLRQRLGKDLEAGSLSHAYIIEGPKGIGKSTLALEMAMALACESSADETEAEDQCEHEAQGLLQSSHVETPP